MKLDPKVYDCVSFGTDEIWSWLKWQNEYDSIVLYGNSEELDRCRKRFLNMGNRNGIIFETTMKSDKELQVTYRGLTPSKQT